jgi:NAD(P)H-nitrite reductase large subunit
MEKIDYVVIGGGIAGTNAAFKIRTLDPEASIRIYSDEPFPVYSRVTLGKYVYGGQNDETIILKKQKLYEEKNIELVYDEVEDIFPDRHLVAVEGHTVEYGKLLLATGGSPRPYPLDGCRKEGVSYFQYLKDAKYIQEQIKNAENIIIIGGGFIGIEFVDILHKMGKTCTLIVRDDWYWQNMIAKEGGEILDAYINEYASVKYQTTVDEIHGGEHIESVKLSNGEVLACDALFIGIGLVLNTQLAAKAGIDVKRGILTDEFLETSTPDVYAAGDIAEYYNPITGKHESGGTWVNASMQGMIAGQNMVSPKSKAFELLPSFAPKIEVPVSFIGNTRICDKQEIKVYQEGQEYTQAHFENGKLVGAVLMYHSSKTGTFMELIKKQVAPEEVEAALNCP